jgi:hypothetical protein
MNEFGEPNMGNPSVRFDEGRERVGQWPFGLSIQPLLPTLPCASEAGLNVGESPTRRVGLFATEHELNSVAARRGWKLREWNRRAVMKMNHI